MKKIKIITLIALSVSLILCLFPFTSMTVSASTNHSQDEAVSWIKARADEGWWEDVDGAYGCQCVDLIMKYKANISVGTWEVSSGLKYAVTAAPDGYIMRPLCSPKRVVNAWGSAPSRGANVNLYDYCSESSQWWKFEPVDGGYIIHSSFNSSCVLDTDGSNVLIEARHGGASQIWVLQTQEEAEAENLGNNHILGDVNEDGKVNLKDVSTIIKYRALWNPDPFNFEAADIYKDGNVNARDTNYLIRHLANWKGYEL